MKPLKYRIIGCTGCNKWRYSTAFYEKELETEYTCYQCQGLIKSENPYAKRRQ